MKVLNKQYLLFIFIQFILSSIKLKKIFENTCNKEVANTTKDCNSIINKNKCRLVGDKSYGY